jgi:hypothetical protein
MTILAVMPLWDMLDWKINDVAIRFFDHDLIVSAVENFRLSLILFDYISHATFPLEIFQEKIPLDRIVFIDFRPPV